MKLSREVKREIAKWVRSKYGPSTIEVGTRDTIDDRRVSANALLWAPGADLFDLVPFDTLKTIDDVPDLLGAATLDLYVYAGSLRKNERELETNVYVTIADGRLADIHDRDLEADNRTRAILGRPFSEPDSLELARANDVDEERTEDDEENPNDKSSNDDWLASGKK